MRCGIYIFWLFLMGCRSESAFACENADNIWWDQEAASRTASSWPSDFMDTPFTDLPQYKDPHEIHLPSLIEQNFQQFCENYKLATHLGISQMVGVVNQWLVHCGLLRNASLYFRTAAFLEEQREKLTSLIMRAYFESARLDAEVVKTDPYVVFNYHHACERVLLSWPVLFDDGEKALQAIFQVNPTILLHLPLSNERIHRINCQTQKECLRRYSKTLPSVEAVESLRAEIYFEYALGYFGEENRDLYLLVRFHVLGDQHPALRYLIEKMPYRTPEELHQFVHNARLSLEEFDELFALLSRFRWFVALKQCSEWLGVIDKLSEGRQCESGGSSRQRRPSKLYVQRQKKMFESRGKPC